MKRFFAAFTVGTLLALACVHQKVCLIRLGYEVEAQAHLRDDLLDQHRVLQYNVLMLRSPVILHERLAQRNIELIPPRTVEVLNSSLRVGPPVPSLTAAGPAFLFWQRALRLAAGWLGAGRQAVAEPVRGSS